MKDKKIIIPGGTGYMGQAIARYFGKDNDIIVLGRDTARHDNNSFGQKLLQAADGYRIQYLEWDGKNVQNNWLKAIDGADIIINLAGKSVNCRYRQKNKQAIIDSRVSTTNAIGDAIRRTTTPPKLWINAASATIYKNSTNKPQDEFTGEISELKKDNMPYSLLDQLRFRKKKFFYAARYGKESELYKDLDKDFSVKVCKLWESAFFEQRTPFTRKIALRTAITLGKGGVMVPYLALCKAGLGGRHGNGQQMFSWVHEEDVCRMIEWLWENKELEGVINCAAPEPVTNSHFMSTLRTLTGNKLGLPSPTWMLELGAWAIGTETELMLKSRWVLPARALKEGFSFKYDTVQKAVTAILAQ